MCVCVCVCVCLHSAVSVYVFHDCLLFNDGYRLLVAYTYSVFVLAMYAALEKLCMLGLVDRLGLLIPRFYSTV